MFRSDNFTYFNLVTRKSSNSIDFFFPHWNYEDEIVVIFSPHDDDALLGAGYTISASLANKGNVYIVIFHNGNAGYSDPSLKEKIVEIRKNETIKALEKIGIKKENIKRLNIPDFSGNNYLGWYLPENRELGTFKELIQYLREIKATRLLFSNNYREHIDHEAVNKTAIFYGPQVGDPICVDWGTPQKIDSYFEYAVWGKFETPASHAIFVNELVEKNIQDGILKWKSQKQIIEGILSERKERYIKNLSGYLELYNKIDPRPKLDYTPYKKEIQKIKSKKD